MAMRKKHILLPFIVMGSVYMLAEVLLRTAGGDLVGFKGIKYASLCGWTSWYMFIVGGACAVFIGQLNERPGFCRMRVVYQCLIGTVFILALEFISGYILNIKLGFHIWDYTGLRFNLMGVICPQYAAVWFLLCPIAIWFDDMLKYIFYRAGNIYSLGKLYKELFTLK